MKTSASLPAVCAKFAANTSICAKALAPTPHVCLGVIINMIFLWEVFFQGFFPCFFLNLAGTLLRHLGRLALLAKGRQSGTLLDQQWPGIHHHAEAKTK